MENPFQNRVDLTALNARVTEIKSEIGKVIVGQEQMIDLLLTAILADGHVLIEGVPGVAKTLTAKLLSKIISVDFARVQFTPDLMPSDILGTSVYNLKTSEFEFKAGPVFTNIVLIDEINRAPAKTQSALFEVMEERQVTIDGHTHKMRLPYMVLATQNPIEQEGTYRLPEAQLDRFLFKIMVTYPSYDQEIEILSRHHERKGALPVSEITPLLKADEIELFRTFARQVHIEKNLLTYIAQIIQETRNNPMIFLGASPRASLSVLTGAKAYAILNGRDFVNPEDVKFIATPVLRHRIVLSPEKEMEGLNADEVIAQIINKIEVPR
ncbi:MAG TPA: MoxR family ATPase [Cyclobacteriaceae bacterium]|jgi:MoxR-like ATPase|nr:MoxR family ATPase [Cytophagales bacterium]HMR55751.1 MoxR family ATPase [Cyclobacteriaceae bacterium]HNT49792.1 MoxR family ATPase [Cyclobacteriaceae bacterium]HRE67972.1 MoxR family ATPase [Cyclobacteriaceae bacterium]HRF33606.1 MoxR family ATPase [Cyclobacteriaceae bacterium]